MSAPIKSVLVCGSGLAYEMTLAALSLNLPGDIQIIALQLGGLVNRDSFYGHLTAPSAYNFFLSLGLDEPNLILNSQTNFSFGTAYESWAGHLNWTQCFHQPFPVWDNIAMHQYAVHMKAPFSAFLINSVAGLNGRFAHPPHDKNNPLSRAEYGYVFDPDDITALLRSATTSARLVRQSGVFSKLLSKNGTHYSLELDDGTLIETDFIVDCSGYDSPLSENFELGATRIAKTNKEAVTPGISLKHIKANPMGWESVVRLQRENLHLSVGLEGSISDPDYVVGIGRKLSPWKSNYLALGHAACVVEPLTPAPMMLLQRDIERLLSLFPVSSDMTVEAKEYNRLSGNDLEHCQLFQRSMFEIKNAPKSAYWNQVTNTPAPKKLERKIEQFLSRGYVTMYDLEPFHAEDWIIQHFGLGRQPERYDIYLDQLSEKQISQRLGQLSANINSMVQKMPPGDRYVQNFRRYLEKKHGV